MAPAPFDHVKGRASLADVAKLIKGGKAKRIVLATGAGISTSAGIPDFRSPGTGLYDNLQEYDVRDRSGHDRGAALILAAASSAGDLRDQLLHRATSSVRLAAAQR